MRRFNLALKLLWRDMRSGELTLLLAALIIAVTSSTAIALFSDRLQRTMTLQTAEFLAADLVIATAHEIPSAWLSKAQELQLTDAHTVEFSSVLIEHEEILLASIKAVSSAYPLRGQLKIKRSFDDADETIRLHGPEVGNVWVEKRLLSALKLQMGDSLTIGDKNLTITAIISYEPDKQGDFYSLSPRVMMHADDLPATHSIQPGSHVHYAFQFIGSAEALQDFNNWLKPQLNPSQRLMDIYNDRPELGAALNRAQQYLGLSSILVIVIAGVAIAMATRRYSERHFDNIALLRCLGSKQQEILGLYGCQFIVLGLFASLVGCLFGWFLQLGLLALLKNLLPQQIAEPSMTARLFGFVIAQVMLIGFALPPLLQLKQVSPLRVLRRDVQPLPISGWLVYGLSLTVIAVLIWQYTQDIKMTITLLIAGIISLLILGVSFYGLLTVVQKRLPTLNLYWRFGLQGLTRNRRITVQQLLAFSLTITAMILSFTVRNDLLDNWQQQLPIDAPNHFALNIFPEQQAALQQDMLQQAIASSHFYPVVRGRLVTINNTPVQKIVSKDSQGEAATQRELSLTWTTQLPEKNKITAGQWWSAQEQQSHLVSVEQKLANNLHIKLGDQLGFTIGSQTLTATVASLRSLRWDTMTPNFYMIFSPRTLDEFPSTFLTSFYLSSEQKDKINTLVKKYPNMTVLEVDLILQQFKTILAQLTQAINYLLYFALLAGFTVLLSAVNSTLDLRIQQAALMRTLGANRYLLNAIQQIELGALGLLAGSFAVMMAETINFILYSQIMEIDYHPSYELWLIVPFISCVSVAGAGFWGLRGVLNQAPLKVLREL